MTSFKAEASDQVHQTIHLLAQRRKDRLLSDSMGALSKSVIFPFLKILFSCSAVCPSMSSFMPSLFLKSAKRHSGCCYFLLLLYVSIRPLFSLTVVKRSPLWILMPHLLPCFSCCFLDLIFLQNRSILGYWHRDYIMDLPVNQ